MAEAVLKPAEDPVVDPFFRLAHEEFSERTVHCATRLCVAGKQEWQIDEAQLGHAVGEIARRLIAKRNIASLNQRKNVLGLVAVITDVEDVLNSNVATELLFQPVANELKRLAEPRRRRPIAAHSNFDWLAHFHLLGLDPFYTEARNLVKPGRCGRLGASVTEDDADEQACQCSQNVTGWNFSSRMAGACRSRRRLSPHRALWLGRRELQPFLDAPPGWAAQTVAEER